MICQENWIFAEDITVEYAFAQSVLFKIYGNSLQETGHLTRGHVCVTESDRVNAQHVKSSLLYGELLPRGANKVIVMLQYVGFLFSLCRTICSYRHSEQIDWKWQRR